MYLANEDEEYQTYMNLRDFIIKPYEFYIKKHDKMFNMVIEPEVALSFHNLQPFFSKFLITKFLNPFFKSIHHGGQISEIYDPTSDILSDYEFASLEFSDISPFDFDQIMLQNLPKTPSLTYMYHFVPIKIQYSTLPKISQHIFNIHNPSFPLKYMAQKNAKIYYFYQSNLFDFIDKNIQNYYSLENHFLVQAQLQKFYTYKFKHFNTQENLIIFSNRFYRYVALIFFDFFKIEKDPYLTYYKIIRKNQFIFPTYKTVLIYPIFKYRKK